MSRFAASAIPVVVGPVAARAITLEGHRQPHRHSHADRHFERMMPEGVQNVCREFDDAIPPATKAVS